MQEQQISIRCMGKVVAREQLQHYLGSHGECVFELQRKNCKVILHSASEMNIIIVTDKIGKIVWLGTCFKDIKIKSVDVVVFETECLSRFSYISVVDTNGLRYEVPVFSYSEQAIIPEKTIKVIGNQTAEEVL